MCVLKVANPRGDSGEYRRYPARDSDDNQEERSYTAQIKVLFFAVLLFEFKKLFNFVGMETVFSSCWCTGKIMYGMKTKILDSLFKMWLLITSHLPSRLPAPSPDSADDLESQAPPSSGVREPDSEKELRKTLLGLCFAAAIQIATQSKQAAESGINNSISLLSLGTAAIFAALFTSHFIREKMQDASTSHFIREKMQVASRVLEKVAFFLAATTFFFAIATPCNFGIRCGIWALYSISLIVIAICNFL